MEIKLVIWDLDDTLWNGTLAENDELVLNTQYVQAIRDLNVRGVVSSICSKNDRTKAQSELEKLELWDQFVFPHIDFSPKGEMISSMVEQMQLRAVNVLFIDDNMVNLQEVRAKLPEINVADARDPATAQLLDQLVQQYEGVRKSRIEKYRSLEARQQDWTKNTDSRESFLASCEIEMAIVKMNDNSDFVDRIEELINRTNQMNFTQSRVENGSMKDILVHNNKTLAPYSVFAWDKYGYHGLIGFAMVENEETLRHFLFSCRIMHMGVEQRLLAELRTLYPDLSLSGIPVEPSPSPWIKIVNYSDPAVREKILKADAKKAKESMKVRISANCQSASIAHYAGLLDIADTDLWPRLFSLQAFLTGEMSPTNRGSPLEASREFPDNVIYGVFSELEDNSWSPDIRPELIRGKYREYSRPSLTPMGPHPTQNRHR